MNTIASQLYIYPLKPGTCLKVEGEDAFSFLQSQFSNDIKTSQVTYGLWLTKQGKIQADSFIVKIRDNAYWVFSDFSSSEVLKGRFESYLIADDVTLEDLTPTLSSLAIWTNSIELLTEIMKQQGINLDAGNPFQGKWILFGARHSQSPNWTLLGKKEDISAFAKNLENFQLATGKIHFVNENDFFLERYHSGIVTVTRDVYETDLPQEALLEKEAVSFEKGCYLGQEVMARLHAMGQAQRKIFKLKIFSEILNLETFPISLYTEEGKSVGDVRSVVQDNGQHYGYGMLKTRFVQDKQMLYTSPTLEAKAAVAEVVGELSSKKRDRA